ncbi:MAG: thioredoxin family protein [Lewinella sp.]
MKKVIVILMIVLSGSSLAFAQDWKVDLDEAKEIATEEGKAIVLVFQGSDWCAPCIKLDRDIWRSDAFKAYADDHFVMLQADFPRRKQNALSESQVAANAQLAETYNKRGGFPFVVVLDSDGNVLGETGYKKATPEEYIEVLNSFVK